MIKRTNSALNLNRLEQSACGHEQYCFGQTVPHAGNIKIKRNF